MKRELCVWIAAVLLAGSLWGCGRAAAGTESSGKGEGVQTPAEPAEASENVPEVHVPEVHVPGEIRTIPDAYFRTSDKPGKLEDLEYNTWESFSYEDKTTPLTKHAMVYLPYGYNEKKKYDIFYLMHGGWSDHTTALGTPDRPSNLKNAIDHAMEDGKLEPVIIVCPTYNNTNASGLDSNNFSLALQLTDQYHQELLQDLMPAVEGKYSTWAAGTTPADFRASRDHRGFGGFSMGSVTTWHTFQYDLDYFRYFLPMSCGTTLDDEKIWKAAGGHDPSDYFVLIMTGTEDFAYSYENDRTEKMADSDYFTSVDTNPAGNFAYRVKKGYSHDETASTEYTLNGLEAFFGKQKLTGQETAGGKKGGVYTEKSRISRVMADAALGNAARLLFPVNSGYWSGDTLKDLQLTWYNDIDPEMTVDIVNTLHDRAAAGETVFYDIYTDEEKKEDPDKENTGLFFFRGKPGAKTAIVNAGGGFVYVGAMQDSFPVALTLSRMGYNAFALIYRPDAETACEDLARAVAFLEDHAEELQIDMQGYSLWGGSAGARMADWVGTYGTAEFGEKKYPGPGTIVMQYTGLSEVTGNEPPTYACVGTADGIASSRVMQQRIRAIRENGTPAEIDVFKGLPHGFGLGTGTVAEGWINHAVDFWEENTDRN